MIEYLYLGITHCKQCGVRLEFDTRQARKKPRLCPKCKEAKLVARETTRRAKVKSNSVNSLLLEKLAVRSYEEVGAIVGLSKESVRKIEQAALAKLRTRFGALKTTVLSHCDETEAF